ncbi:hypothetical protein [Bacteroides sp.]|jgi:hypothetical protein|uniref:hypothetical protein n=1 Tax=Bacteroides sp. TaxID=29523 RepID=UPI0026338F3D|nr:hypothetical protein [Bacteroides sp.]MDD3038050.1 hypothetical protein [Bacteroides sp.]
MNNSQKMNSVASDKQSVAANDVKHLLEILLNKGLYPSAFGSEPEMEQFLKKYELWDDYNKVGHTGALLLKAGEILEKENLLSHGATEKLLKGEGFDISKIREGIAKQVFDEPKIVDAELDKEMAKRLSVPYVDRLLDIYRHGFSEADRALFQTSDDPFLYDTYLAGKVDKSVAYHKEAAWAQLVDYIGDLRPGMLSDAEIVSLTQIPPLFAREGRELESNLMNLPKEFFPAIESSKEFDENMVDYVKVMRGIGSTTPEKAFHSMEYYLSHRLHTEWDPTGADDEFGRVVGCYYYPNADMKNPIDKIAPGLLSEQQLGELRASHSDASRYLPEAFDKNRISDVQIYSLRDGGMAIRCKIDDEQQGSKVLLNTDTIHFNDLTDRKELAKKYFADSFQEDREREVSLRR